VLGWGRGRAAGAVALAALARALVGPPRDAELAAHLLEGREGDAEGLGGVGLRHAEHRLDSFAVHLDGEAALLGEHTVAGLAAGEEVHAGGFGR
jgi:hypothetical protein